MNKRHWMWVLWPAFLAAGVLEMLVFAVIDPEDVRWMGHSLTWPRQAIYSLGFFIFWGVTAVASSLSLVLSRSGESVNEAGKAAMQKDQCRPSD